MGIMSEIIDVSVASVNSGVAGSGLPILVGVDGSDASYKAVWFASNYAAHAGLPLRIVCAFTVACTAAYGMGYDDDTIEIQDILSKSKKIAVEQGIPADKVYTYAVTGDPASVLVELSRSCDLIIIGNRGKGGLAERILGTTSSILPAKSSCPVIVVPFSDDSGRPVHMSSTLKRIVVASDETPCGIRAMQIAADIADGWSAKLDVMSAYPSLNKNKHDDADRKAIHDEYARELDARIENIKSTHPDTNINGIVHEGGLLKPMLAMSKGVPGDASDVYADSMNMPDMIVVGSRGRAGLTGLLLGSMSQSLIQHSNIPVYVVPRKYVDYSAWKSERTGDMRKDADRINKQMDGTVQKIDVDPAETSVIKPIIDNIDTDVK